MNKIEKSFTTVKNTYGIYSIYSLIGLEEVKTVKKKILVAVLLAAVMLATPFIGTVMAGKGQEKLSIRFELGAAAPDASYPLIRNSPKKIELPEFGRITHFRDADWGSPELLEDFMIVVDEGGLDIEIENDDITYTCSYDAEFHSMNYPELPPYVILNIRVSETWVIDSDDYEGYIEIQTVDRVYDYVGVFEGTHGEGSLVGHGVINGQNIKLSGKTTLEGSSTPSREGMVMGWPT
jgi:hypothetical protein